MKKLVRLVSIALVAIILAVGLFGCFGNMSLHRKVYDWNDSISNKYLQQVAFWVMNIIPVYGVATFIDVVFLNTIEFWTGTNPVTMNATDQEIKYTRQGDKLFEFKISQNKVIITQTEGPEAGKQVQVTFDPASSSWYLSGNGEEHKIATLNGDNLSLIYPDGQQQLITLAK